MINNESITIDKSFDSLFYSLEYSMYLAENEMNENLQLYSSLFVNESAGLIYINEGVKETITTYLEKIVNATQGVWDKFKEILEKKNEEYLASIKDQIESAEPEFTIKNFQNYNLDKIEAIKVIPFDYERMKDSLDSKEKFVKAFYPTINIDDEKSIKKAVYRLGLGSKQDVRCTKEILNTMYDFCTNKYKSHMDKLEIDIKSVNTSKNNIQNIISTINNSQQQSTQESFVNILNNYSIITEAEDNKKDDSVKFEDDKDKKGGAVDITKKVTVYCKASTDVLTGKMKLLKDIYVLYIRTLKHQFKPKKKEDKKQETSENNNKTVKDIET